MTDTHLYNICFSHLVFLLYNSTWPNRDWGWNRLAPLFYIISAIITLVHRESDKDGRSMIKASRKSFNHILPFSRGSNLGRGSNKGIQLLKFIFGLNKNHYWSGTRTCNFHITVPVFYHPYIDLCTQPVSSCRLFNDFIISCVIQKSETSLVQLRWPFDSHTNWCILKLLSCFQRTSNSLPKLRIYLPHNASR